MYNWYGLNQIEDDSWLTPRMQSTIPLLLTSVYPA